MLIYYSTNDVSVIDTNRSNSLIRSFRHHIREQIGMPFDAATVGDESSHMDFPVVELRDLGPDKYNSCDV